MFPVLVTILSPAEMSPDGNENFAFLRLEPNLVDIKRHGARKIGNRLLWVQSSSISPRPSINITDAAVEKSPLKIETETAVAS